MADLKPEEKKVLAVLAQAGEPQSGKQVALTAGLEAKAVSNLIKELKGKGLVDSPVRCKYGVTAQGKSAL